MFRTVLLAISTILASGPLAAMETSEGRLRVDPVVTDLNEPWSVGFLPDGGVLITELAGNLLLWADGQISAVEGLPPVANVGQGGLLDVLVPADFADTRELFFSFAKPQGRSEGTALLKARLSDDNTRLEGAEVIFEMAEGSSGGRHFGSRIVEAPDGTLFLTIGDRGDGQTAQDLRRKNGSVVRIARDGSVPADNPFVDQPGSQPAIWSYGHRNPQGAALDLEGNLLTVEHGAQGGDEINRISRGANYGWPVISYGVDYGGAKIGIGTEALGMEQPEFYWDPSMAPSGMMIYSGALWPEWTGDIFVGSLKFDYIARLDGSPLREVEQLTSDETLRVRDVREAPDGSIWFLSVGNGTLYRVTPD